MTGIQTQETEDAGGGLNVGWIDAGDSLVYVLDVTEAGTYQVDFRIASLSNGAHFDLYQDEDILLSMSTYATGGWQTWQTFTSSSVTLTPGTYTFTIVATDAGFNLNYFEFKRVGL